jgi:hypothetical protein
MKFTSLPTRHNLLASAAMAIAFGAILQAGESKAQQSVSCNPGVAGSCAAGLSVGDKLANAFSFLGDFNPTADDELKFSFDPTTGVYQLQLEANPDRSLSFGASAATDFFYTISIINPGLAAGNTFAVAQSNITGSTIAFPPANSGSYTTTITSSSLTGPITAASGSNPSGFVAFKPGVTSASFKQSFSATGVASVSSLGISFLQQTPPSEVPGPLPLLGAGAAFAFSRKMRRRIRQTA